MTKISMRVHTRESLPRTEGDYRVEITPGYGDPTGDMILDEEGNLRLRWLSVEDCDRLIRAATEIRKQVARYTAMAASPHGGGHVHQGICQLCGKPEEDETHLNPPVTESAAYAAARLGMHDGQ